jgi:hypothetical protein
MQELAKNTMSCWLKTSSHTVRLGHSQQPRLDLFKVNATFPLPDLQSQPRDFYQIIGEGEVPLGDDMTTNL